ncbi:cell division cycle protein [Histoplasma capsulatum G186AR]|uniref:Cell division cycle protein n=1 Tax=Ajellomyces capsulatus (strain G186AR / H82 / ATCC MYA-2454 / RMSCC 2432) TaxID=447093 RepID=C0NU18_AJECG|nr:cell division cycle protein [Histoplasma capsulatum G186AR]EEH04898.1 cell division cycle protein [Histoplasma capsulatum G186AR]
MTSSKVADLRWPPRSPYEALMSSPNGRKRFQEMQERRQAGRASLKSFDASPYVRTKANQLLEDGVENDMEEEDEDEETLQLKLAAIEARLKLKKLQQSKSKSKPPSFEQKTLSDTPASPSSRPAMRFIPERKRKAANMSQQENIQVPVSPSKRLAASTDPVSPRRIVLGIDKGKKGTDVSLNRPPSSRSTGRPASSIGVYRGEALLRKTHISASHEPTFTPDGELQRPKSFSERIAESRSIDKSRWEKTQLLHRKRNSSFAVDKGEMERFQLAAKEESEKASNFESPRKAQRVEEFSRDDVIQSYNRPGSGLRKSKNISSASGNCSATQEFQLQMETRPTSSLLNDDSTGDNSQNIKPTIATDPSKFEPFSGLHLSTRILPHSFLNRTLDAKSPMRIPDLLRTIKGPEFDPPDVDGDYVVFGIIASKSTPKEHQDVKKGASKHKNLDDDGSNNTSKYMVLTLTDLKWSIDLFLFSTAFPRYYKLIPGTVVAILNPSIMPPPPNKLDTNRFSLTLNSSDDTILEIGKAQDLGFCKAIRKDGKVCEAWVDGRKTEFCEFHVDLQLRKTTAKRMEVNGGPTTFGPGGRSGSRTGMFNKNRDLKDRDRYRLKPEGPQTDRSTGSTYYVGPPIPGSRSAASLIDADDPFIVAANDFPRGGNGKLERFQKRLAEQERERNIAKVLGRSNSVGAQYLRHRQAGGTSGRDGSDANAPSNNTRPSSGAGNNINGKGDESGSQPARVALGLSSTMKSAVNVKLGPIKKSAVNKKTRFVTSKGIRDAGRDSLGGPGDGTGNDNNADYDDDLDIV